MITRSNYEEYFLLYADNELSAAERHEVERFIADHPDLREEWDSLLQCKLSPDTHLVFPGRASLLKPESGASSYTEELLLYLDGELDQAAATRIESLLRQQPRMAKEFAELRQTVSRPDPAILFPGKSGLYKKEKTRRVVALTWARVGIAASVAGALALLLVLRAKPVPHTSATAIRTATHAPTAAAPAATSSTAAVPTAPAAIHSRNFTSDVTFIPVAPLHNTTGQQRTKKLRHADLAVSHPARPAADAVTSDTDPSKFTADPSKVNTDPSKFNADPPGMDLPPHAVATTATAALAGDPATRDLAANLRPSVETGIPKEQSSFATQALQEEALEERNNILVSDEPAAPGRAKLRGLLRKVTRAFEKTADRDGDGNRQVLVGAFPVSLD